MRPVASTAIPRGPLKEEEKPTVAPAAPVPASVITKPEGYATRRMRWFSESPTTMAPLVGSNAPK
jgi:hypothetical protein